MEPTSCVRISELVGLSLAWAIPSLEMSLPFGRRDLQLVRSGSAAVLRVDAVRGSPDGDFTKKADCRVPGGAQTGCSLLWLAQSRT